MENNDEVIWSYTTEEVPGFCVTSIPAGYCLILPTKPEFIWLNEGWSGPKEQV